MGDYKIIKIKDKPEFLYYASNWFHEKWGVPLEAYAESMRECINGQNAVPSWYIVLDKEKIIGGLGVIENDFHDRKDLTPNVCAVYVEKDYRCQGIAGEMLQFVCDDMREQGINTLYLLTDHDTFYERYGWKFLCMVQGDGEEELSRMYVHEFTIKQGNNY